MDNLKKFTSQKLRVLRSISTKKLNSLPRISTSSSANTIKKKIIPFRENSVKKHYKNVKVHHKILDNRGFNRHIEDELIKLDKLTQRNQEIRIDWVNIQERMIQLGVSSATRIKENFYQYSPLKSFRFIKNINS
jgi:hypothetical protein